MPIVSTVKGDLVKRALAGEYTHIVHGANTHAAMGAGIAPLIADAFEGVREADESFHIPVDSEDRLGHYSHAHNPEVCVINMYTQHYFRTRPDGTHAVDYNAIANGFARLNDELSVRQKDTTLVGIPALGAGLAKGHWEAIACIINLVTPDIDIELVIFEG